eukprot:110596_1
MPRNNMNPSLKRKIRSMKNSMRRHDQGQILISELTSNTNTLPQPSVLHELVQYLIQNERTADKATFKLLWKRLTDYRSLRHVEKSLLVIEHLLSQKRPLYSISFEMYCTDHKPELIKLQKYKFRVGRSEIGRNVRERARNIYQILFKTNVCARVTRGSSVKGKPMLVYGATTSGRQEANWWENNEMTHVMFDMFGDPVPDGQANDRAMIFG